MGAAMTEQDTSAGGGSIWDSLSPAEPVEMPQEQAEAYEDPAVTALSAEGEEPQWLATRWRELPEEEMGQVWAFLREWVDWLVEAHRVPQDEIPACWFRHPDIVEELWAAAGAETQAWEATSPTMMPMTAWHFHLRMMRDRLRGRAKECVAKKAHVPARSFAPGIGAWVLPVDEADWAAHLAEVQDRQPVQVEAVGTAALWRMCAVDESGAVTVSEAVDVGPESRLAAVTISQPSRRGRDSEGSVVLGATVDAGGGEIRRTWWESSADGGQSWEKVVTSEVDRGRDDEQKDERA